MKSRKFARSGNGLQRSAYRIFCSKCGCSDEVRPGNSSGTLPPEALNKMFAQKGWNVGKSEDKDICPGCELKKAPDRALVLKFPGSPRSIPIGIVEMPKRDEGVRTMGQDHRAEKPKQMGRDERRLIFEKLNEVYLDERRGYSDGWSDTRVADNMGVPRAWIAEVREPNFGPDKNEEQRVAIIKECKKVLSDCDRAISELQKARAELLQKMTGFEAA